MPALFALVARLMANPFVANLIVPALSRALTNFFEKQANRIELKGAIKASKAAQTAEEIRDASKKLSDSASRR